MGCIRVEKGPHPRLVEADGTPFRFVLINAYYLQEEAARHRTSLLDEVFAKAFALGARVVRSWGFNDGWAPEALQTGRLEYNESGLQALDCVIERAAAHGLRLILPLVNYWNDYGGVRQWLRWNGFEDAVEGDVRFFTEPKLWAHYAAHVEGLMARSNALTGAIYAEDPTILAWEVMNEPRGRGLDRGGVQMGNFVDLAARSIRQAGAQQLIAVGEEGLDVGFDGYDRSYWQGVGAAHLFRPENGSSFARNVASPDVDFATCHFYPEAYGIRSGAEDEAGCVWIQEHARLAHSLGKPLVLEEFALRNDLSSLELRRRAYQRWLAQAVFENLAGIGPWLFAHDSRPAGWDPYSFYLRTGTGLADPANSYGDLLAAAASDLEVAPA